MYSGKITIWTNKVLKLSCNMVSCKQKFFPPNHKLCEPMMIQTKEILVQTKQGPAHQRSIMSIVVKLSSAYHEVNKT